MKKLRSKFSEMKNRDSWSGQLAFVIASAASAIGLGNLWRFPYLAAKYGGGVFLLVYVLLLVTLGFTLMVTEVSIGRKIRLSPLEGFSKVKKEWGFIGWIFAIVPAIILPYYVVIGGWVTKYLVSYLTCSKSVTSPTHPASEGFFSAFISNPSECLLYAVIFGVIVTSLITLGVKNGIEKSNKILMPLLFILAVGIAGYSCLRPGAIEGVKYYLIPDFSRLCVASGDGASGHFSFVLLCKTFVAAMGQMFFSLSLAMGIMITYGSYMRKEDAIEVSSRRIEMCDTFIALTAGLMIVPAAFAFPPAGQTGLEAVSKAGPGLLFETLPRVFVQMGDSKILASAFFILVFSAALTNGVSMMETMQSSLRDKMGWSRARAVVVIFIYMLALGVPSTLCSSNALGGIFAKKIAGMDFLAFNDFLANSVLMPLGAFATCIFIGWIVKPSFVIVEVESEGHVFKGKKFYSLMIRWIAPVLILVIFITCIMSGLGLVSL
jgi:NSS family neurotransmitter:Na+ symporter